MESIKVDLPSELDYIDLHIFADLHIGDKSCDLPRIRQWIDAVANDKNAYCILNGDILNNATKSSVSDGYAEEMSPMDALNLFVELFDKIKGKILAVSSGNHEERTWRDDGIDLTGIASRELGVGDRYARSGGVLFVRFGKTRGIKTGTKNEPRKMVYSIYFTHGSGGGRKEGAKAIRLADMANIADCDIFIHSHTHQSMSLRNGFYRVDKHNLTVRYVDRLFCNTAAQLNFGGYGQRYEFKPSSKETPVIRLDGHKKGMVAKL